jgi:hypothetical protein
MIAVRKNLTIAGRTLSVLALMLSITPGCITEPDAVTNDSTNTIIQIVSMEAQIVDDQGPGEVVSDLFSDVCFSASGAGCSVFNDNGIVTMRVFPKDRTQLASEINTVTIERYRVTYIRADGRNVVGVDVPYPFDGVANFLIPITGDEVIRPFIVVRHQAKVESPLREIQNDITKILSVIGQVDFYGHDSAGRAITVTGYLNITFADFAN